jgi:hypothetical protein
MEKKKKKKKKTKTKMAFCIFLGFFIRFVKMSRDVSFFFPPSPPSRYGRESEKCVKKTAVRGDGQECEK